MYTIEDLKNVFENTTTEVLLYNSREFNILYVGPIVDIPDKFDNCYVDLYEATWETKNIYPSVSYEVSVLVK